MGNEFHEFFRTGFNEAALEVSTNGTPLRIFFNGRFADTINGPVAEAQEMKSAGIDPVADEACVILAEDFAALGATFEDEVEVAGRMLRIKTIQRAVNFVIVGMKALR